MLKDNKVIDIIQNSGLCRVNIKRRTVALWSVTVES